MRFVSAMSITSKLKSVHPAIYWSIFSGMAALIYQVVLQKLFTYVLGYALLSTTIVIAAYMLGLASGGFIAGLFCDRLTFRGCLALYSAVESGIGIFGLGSLIAYKVYLSQLPSLIANPVFIHFMSSVAFRSVLAMSLLLPMTVLMGATLPILTLGVGATTSEESKNVSKDTVTITALYSANLLGGMAGVIVSAYLVIPYFGLWGAAILACCANFLIAVLILRFRSSPERRTAQRPEPLAVSSMSTPLLTQPLSRPMVGFLSFASGLVMFALEIVWTHLLGAVIGLSVYAFANMLIAVFIGLYLAAALEARPGRDAKTPLSRLVLWGGILLALSIPCYAWSPLLFSLLGLFSPGFYVRSAALLAVGCFLIVPAAMVLSRIFPRLLAEGVAPGRKGRDVGFLLAINTFGCLLGLFLGNFVLIPVFGSEMTLKGLAVLLALIAGVVYLRNGKSDVAPAWPLSRLGFSAPLLALTAVILPLWPPSLLLSGRSVYFSLTSEAQYAPLYYMGEDAEGGFVTVSGLPDGTIELRTDGKFQGDNREQMKAQYSFGYLPALAARHTGKAFLIGCGTGVSVRALADAGFQHITLAEISRNILFAARNYFRKENGGILDDPRVTIIHDDGRNALALSRDQYDVISIELTSIWFAGAANLYSSDFYAIAHQKLAPGGVLQQWVQLHHMRPQDLDVIINTVHSKFKYVALWYSGSQGQLLASDQPLSLDWERMRSLAASYPDTAYLSADDLYQIPYQIVLDDSGARHGPGTFVSSDLDPYLEYATPRGNAIKDLELLNVPYLERMSGQPRLVSFRNLPDADLPLANALLAYRLGACDAVKAFLSSAAAPLGKDESTLLDACTPGFAISRVDIH